MQLLDGHQHTKWITRNTITLRSHFSLIEERRTTDKVLSRPELAGQRRPNPASHRCNSTHFSDKLEQGRGRRSRIRRIRGVQAYYKGALVQWSRPNAGNKGRPNTEDDSSSVLGCVYRVVIL